MPPKRPQDYNAFGYDPRGTVANAAGLLFGENWRPNQQDIPRYTGPGVAAPRFGPPADYQQPYLPQNFAPQLPPMGYLGALQYQRREGPWANYPYAVPAAHYPPHPPPLAPRQGDLVQYPSAAPPPQYRHTEAAPPASRPLANGEVRTGGIYIYAASICFELTDLFVSIPNDCPSCNSESGKAVHIRIRHRLCRLPLACLRES